MLVVALGRHAHPVMVHMLVALRRPAHGRAPVNQLPYFGLLIGDVVGELRLLEAGGGHALVPAVAGGGALRRVGRVQAGLDEPLARVGGDHGLQLARGERVHVAGL